MNNPAGSISESAKMMLEVTSDSMPQQTPVSTALVKTLAFWKGGRIEVRKGEEVGQAKQ